MLSVAVPEVSIKRRHWTL